MNPAIWRDPAIHRAATLAARCIALQQRDTQVRYYTGESDQKIVMELADVQAELKELVFLLVQRYTFVPA